MARTILRRQFLRRISQNKETLKVSLMNTATRRRRKQNRLSLPSVFPPERQQRQSGANETQAEMSSSHRRDATVNVSDRVFSQFAIREEQKRDRKAKERECGDGEDYRLEQRGIIGREKVPTLIAFYPVNNKGQIR
jgi:hypothetical protein